MCNVAGRSNLAKSATTTDIHGQVDRLSLNTYGFSPIGLKQSTGELNSPDMCVITAQKQREITDEIPL
jgi:hypothetical protein